jgi:serine protease Do
LVNVRGEVIGIASQKYTSYSSTKIEGMSFAVPISKVIPVINELMNRVELDQEDKGYLGIEGKDVSDSYSKTFSMPKGVYVFSTDPGSPADTAGIRAGDIITEINGREVVNMQQLKEILSYIKYGTEVEIKISTKGRTASGYEDKTITVVLGKRSDYEKTR